MVDSSTPRDGHAVDLGDPTHVTDVDTAPGHATLPVPGERVGPYELIRQLGRGGMGVVYSARDTKLGRRVAIKFLRDVTGVAAQRFMVEARTTARCTHENIVVIHEVGSHREMPYMVLELLEGQTLRAKLGKLGEGRPLPASRVVETILPVARALESAHARGIIHRDLKPENVFLTSSGHVKVLDFGIAKKRSKSASLEISITQALERLDVELTTQGALVGTLPYMSPEQLGIAEIDPRSDLWAVGIIMFEMLTGRHPIDPLTTGRLVEVFGNYEHLPSVRQLVPDAPPQLIRLVDACLQIDIDERLASSAELVKRLEQLVPPRRRRKLGEDDCPYPGLASFQEQDADRFFGRDRELARVVARVRDLPLTAVVGPSGAGKSSFVRAGLAPALQAAGERWETIALRPGRHPLATLVSTLERHQPGRDPIDRDRLARQLMTEPGFLGAALRRRARDTEHGVLLFVDQFEELYTLVADPAERLAFTSQLAGAADDTAAPVRVVLAMRSDFLDRLGEDERLLDEVTRGLVFLGAIDRAGLRDAIVQPLEGAGYRLESEAMIEQMLDELSGTPGPLPLLQFAASKLWESRDRQRKILTAASYRASGGVTGALAAHADEVIATMSASSRDVARQILRRLVTAERTRAIGELAELAAIAPERAESRRVIDQLVAARLLVVQTRDDGEGASVELVHESLIERWPALRRWLDEDHDEAAFRAQLATAAKQWEAMKRSQGLLWRGDAAEDARRWYAQRARKLPAREQSYLDAVFSLARRSRRRKSFAIAFSLVVLAGAATTASLGYLRVRAAEEAASTEAVAAHKALDDKSAEEKKRIAAEEQNRVALASLLTEKGLREAAEQHLLSAQDQVKAAKSAEQIAAANLADAERAAKEHRAAALPAPQPLLSREELADRNDMLEAALAEAKAARARSEKATAEATAAKAELEKVLARERALAAKREQELSKMSTTLK